MPQLHLQVEPGPQAVVERFEFNAVGPLQEAAEAGDLAARVLIAQVRNEWQLPPEWAFRQSDWSSAKNAALAKLRADGYPSATWGATSARVDEATHSVALALSADSGALYRLGSLDIDGLQHYGVSTVNHLWTLQPGTPYREADLLDFQDRLQKAGLFEGASVLLDTAPATSQAAPVTVRVRELTLQSSAPALTYEEGSLVKRAIRDLYNKDIDEVLVAGEAAYKDAKDFMRMLMPSHAKNVKPYKDSRPLFSRYQAESQLDGLYSPTVTLPSGGYMVINQTEALVAVDINSGKATREHNIEDTAYKTNLEAADEIARQLRIRDIGGLIVIDFIDMEIGRAHV